MDDKQIAAIEQLIDLARENGLTYFKFHSDAIKGTVEFALSPDINAELSDLSNFEKGYERPKPLTEQEKYELERRTLFLSSG